RAANRAPRRAVRADGDGDTGSRPPRLVGGWEGPRRDAKPLASNGSKEGSNRKCARVLPTFLSKVRACTVWPATGLAPSERGAHRSGTVPGSHRTSRPHGKGHGTTAGGW